MHGPCISSIQCSRRPSAAAGGDGAAPGGYLPRADRTYARASSGSCSGRSSDIGVARILGQGLADVRGGAVVLGQRFGGSLSLSVHLHAVPGANGGHPRPAWRRMAGESRAGSDSGPSVSLPPPVLATHYRPIRTSRHTRCCSSASWLQPRPVTASVHRAIHASLRSKPGVARPHRGRHASRTRASAVLRAGAPAASAVSARIFMKTEYFGQVLRRAVD